MSHVHALIADMPLDVESEGFWEFSRRFDQIRLEVAAELGLNFTDLTALHAVHRSAGCTAGDLARALDLTTSATTTVVDRLVSRNFVERRRDTFDRRRIQLFVTTLGRHGATWSTAEAVGRVGDVVGAVVLGTAAATSPSDPHTSASSADRVGVLAPVAPEGQDATPVVTVGWLDTGSGT